MTVEGTQIEEENSPTVDVSGTNNQLRVDRNPAVSVPNIFVYKNFIFSQYFSE